MPEATLSPPSVQPRNEVAPVRVSGLALATPRTSFTQDEVLELLGLAEDPFASGVFARAGVRRRFLGLPEDGGLAGTLQDRTAATEAGLFRLAVQAIDELALDPSEIGVVVSGTYYSLGGPTLAHRIVDHYGLDAATDKYHVVGVGCASAVPLFRLALGALRERGRQALVVGAESISGFLTEARPGDERVKAVGAALFGDGCAAALLESGDDDAGPGPAIVASAVHQVPGTLDHVRFRVTGDDSYLRIARELPALAEAAAPPLVEDFLRQHGLTRADVDHWLVHPGGRGILEGLQGGLGLSDEQVGPSARVLAEFGNVGTPSGLFVLARTMEERSPAAGEHGLMLTIGPGVTVGLMLLRWGAGPEEEVAP